MRRRKAGAKRPGGRGSGLRRTLLRLFGLSFLFFLLALVLYTIYLDRVVQTRFEGKRWAVPARVFARPLDLFVGADIGSAQFEAELERLGYQRADHPETPGTYSRKGERFLLRSRSFDFWDGTEPGRYLELRFRDERLHVLRQAGGKTDVPLVRLEPSVIGSIYPSHNEDRILLRREDLPELLVQTLIAVEDREFFHHHGVDPKAIARAAWANLRAGGVVQGGSTLTQQLVKNFYLTDARSFWRKANEALMALLLEWRYPKDDILEAYANEIFLGQDGKRAIHGFGLGSQFFFNRPLVELDLPQIALLVALVRGPSYYEPRRHPERALERRNLVLGILRDQGVITSERALGAMQAPLGVTDKGAYASSSDMPAFLDLVRRQLHRDYRSEDLTSEGLRIFTTLDPWVQEQAEQGLAGRLWALEQRHKGRSEQLQGAVVVVSAEAGEVLALVGGRDTQYAGFNRALDALRPIGSLIKPVVYLEALSRAPEYTLVSRLEDKGLRLRGPDGRTWSPSNYDHREHGEVLLYSALAHSYNLATVNLGLELGPEAVSRRLQKLGVQRPVNAYPSLLLGAVALSPLEVAQVYQTLAAGGFRTPLRTIREVTDADGQPLQRYPLEVKQVASPAAAHLVGWAMQQVVAEGTGRGLHNFLAPDLDLAGKTGTTDELRDSWFAGFSDDKVMVVWVGRDDNRPAGLSGSSGALQVWGHIAKRIGIQPLVLLPPENVEYVWIDTDTGLLGNERCSAARQIPFSRGSAPTVSASCAAEAGGFFRRLFQ
jgi:penicillin-binding protein 1B